MEVADRIVVMNKGVIEQIGTPAEVYANPASEVRLPLPRRRQSLAAGRTAQCAVPPA